MNYQKWLDANTSSLKNKTIAITGSTGGLGRELCRFLAQLGADLILVDRIFSASDAFRKELEGEYNIKATCITADMSDILSVKTAAEELKNHPVDVFIHNAGAYKIPRKICENGYDNIFNINFISPYYIIKTLLPLLRERKGKVVAVGSIAHNYSKSDINDVDFSKRKACSKVYGNAKRYLMFALHKLFEEESEVQLSITHPGISFTGITNHYPKLIFAIIKHPMKIIFMKPKKACLSILKGVFDQTEPYFWIGPKLFNIWGLPKKQKLKTCPPSEAEQIYKTAERIYSKIG